MLGDKLASVGIALKKRGLAVVQATASARYIDSDVGMKHRHNWRKTMRRSKVAISLDESILNRLDKLVRKQIFPNRSQAIQEAVEEKLARLEKSRLAQECAKLDPAFEKALAEEGLSKDLNEWPEYKSAGPI